MRPTAARALVAAAMSPFTTKRLYIIRHGQAVHNPRAEKARAEGCSHDEFLEIMRQDDCLDAPLTELGIEQAKEGQARYGHLLQDVQLVVSSPLSRALQTADAILPPSRDPIISDAAHSTAGSDHARSFATSSSPGVDLVVNPKRLVMESLREVNGWLLNAKRKSRNDLEKEFPPSWDFSELENEDSLWTNELESQPECAERGYLSLLSLAERSEQILVVVSHGGLLRFTMNMHPNVGVRDGRSGSGGDIEGAGDVRCSKSRFGNCEVRAYELDLVFEDNIEGDIDIQKLRPNVVLTEIDLSRT